MKYPVMIAEKAAKKMPSWGIKLVIPILIGLLLGGMVANADSLRSWNYDKLNFGHKGTCYREDVPVGSPGYHVCFDDLGMYEVHIDRISPGDDMGAALLHGLIDYLLGLYESKWKRPGDVTCFSNQCGSTWGPPPPDFDEQNFEKQWRARIDEQMEREKATKDTDGDGVPDYKDDDYSPPDSTPTTSPSPRPSSASPTPTISPSPQPTSTSPSKGGRWSITIEDKFEYSDEDACSFSTTKEEWKLQGEFDDGNTKPGVLKGTARIIHRIYLLKNKYCGDHDFDVTHQMEMYLFITPGSNDSFRHIRLIDKPIWDKYNNGSVPPTLEEILYTELDYKGLEAHESWNSPGEVLLQEGTQQVLNRGVQYTFKRI